MSKHLKITFLGAGSLGFTRRLVHDLLAVPELRDVELALYDINPGNLDRICQILERDIKANQLPTRVVPYSDRLAALADAAYIACCIRQGGLEAFRTDIEIPLKYGVDQCVGDTLGPGGIMYGQRTIAELLTICRDIRQAARPEALLLNYCNPNAMNTWACNVYGGVPTVGLCHGVQFGASMIRKALNIPEAEFDYSCVGINHQTWYVDVRQCGQSIPQEQIYDALARDPKFAATDKVRLDMFRRFGYFSTESNGHLSEYLPFYRKRPSELLEWIDLSAWINGETGGYLRVCTEEQDWFVRDFPEIMKQPPQIIGERSIEHGSFIIESLETGRVYRGHFNVINRNNVTNLPNGCVVEIPCYVDRNGISVPVWGDLPPGCAAICAASVRVQDLAVRAAVTGDVKLLKQAMLLDPLTGAVCTPPEVWRMADEMLLAQAKWLPQYAAALPEARARLANEPFKSGAPQLNPATRLAQRDPETITRLHREKAAAEAAAAKKSEYDPNQRV